MTPQTDPELQSAAEEELVAATRLTWKDLAPLTPWGDTFEGFGPAGGAIMLERSYIWLNEPGGDILCEVTAYRSASRYDRGVRVSRVIASKS